MVKIIQLHVYTGAGDAAIYPSCPLFACRSCIRLSHVMCWEVMRLPGFTDNRSRLLFFSFLMEQGFSWMAVVGKEHETFYTWMGHHRVQTFTACESSGCHGVLPWVSHPLCWVDLWYYITVIETMPAACEESILQNVGPRQCVADWFKIQGWK